MRPIKILLLACLAAFVLTSCFEDLDDNAIESVEINDFVWKGMNAVYAYKDTITDLQNDRFNTNDEYRNYLNDYATPEDLFESLIFKRESVDEFSRIYDNYIDLENVLQGTTLNNGMKFGLVQLPNAASDIIGYVQYVMPNTDAETKGVARGMIFNTIDGIELTQDNFRDLLSATTYTIGLADYNNNGTPETLDDDIITSNGEAITLTKAAYTENPILTHNVFNLSGSTIGYLMYNNFRIADENLNELNNLFASFGSSGITDLVLDLRYNGGGSVSTAIWLSSMITGQFTGEVFFKERWNSDIQEALLQENPESLINPFVNQMVKRNSNNEVVYQQNINSLNLNKVYIITTGGSASASELLINGLTPYIDVVQIGTTTRGKPQASITIYDSPNFGRADVNPNHFYAMQPLVYESENADGYSQYYDGLGPTVQISEQLFNLSQLGNPEEPLLAEAIADITGLSRAAITVPQPLKHFNVQKLENPFIFDMVDERKTGFNRFDQ